MKKYQDELTTRTRTNIRQLRLSKGLSIPKLAQLVGISVSGMKFIEYGNNKPRENTLKAIAGALGVSVETLTSKGSAPSKDKRGPQLDNKNTVLTTPDQSNIRLKLLTGINRLDDSTIETLNELVSNGDLSDIRLRFLDLINTLDDSTVGVLFDFADRLTRSRVKNSKASNDSF